MRSFPSGSSTSKYTPGPMASVSPLDAAASAALMLAYVPDAPTVSVAPEAVLASKSNMPA